MSDALAATDSFEKQKLCEEADHLKDLLKEAEARVSDLEKLLSAVQNMENFYPDGTGFFVFTKKEADEITWKLSAAEKEVEWKNKVIEAAERRFIEAEAENEKLKNCRNQCKIVCLLEKYNEMEEKMIKEKEALEKAERERDEAVDAICTHCMDFPCQEDDCKWWRGQKEE